VVLQGARHSSFVGRIDPSMEAARLTQEPMLGEPPPRTTMPREPYDPRRPGREGRQGLQFLGTFGHIKALSLAFFDAYLRGDAEGRTALEGAGTRGGVELLRK
jgi:hypothetical protein